MPRSRARSTQSCMAVLVLWAIGAGAWLPLLEVVCRVAKKTEINVYKAVTYTCSCSQFALWTSSGSDLHELAWPIGPVLFKFFSNSDFSNSDGQMILAMDALPGAAPS